LLPAWGGGAQGGLKPVHGQQHAVLVNGPLAGPVLLRFRQRARARLLALGRRHRRSPSGPACG
jgi:hypothetical protein